MKLIVKCNKCRQENKAPHHVNNRVDYAKQHGDNFSLTCKSCNETDEYHVDDIKAVDYTFGEIIKNRLMVFAILFVITLVLGLFVVGFTGAVTISLVLTLTTMLFAKKNNSSKSLTFNKHKLKGRVSGVGFRK
ncbi:hypothetical protein [Saccharicrinis aurantiacus]|uniref:hypothetical protein n=1 Tax=Saccharicrinis aurantiacus TaxID=1849719 RepID=UPI00249205D5|nr:hypothetical protein [Saccharicrinis aurantiacus]